MSDEKDRPQALESLAPIRNFTIRLEDRVRAAAGPPAYMRRARSIEDIEATLLRALTELRDRIVRTGDPALREDAAALRRAILDEAARRRLDVREVNRLITNHNHYYPMEANLPLHPRTGARLERGQPWRPRPFLSMEELVDRILDRAQAG